MPHRESGAYHHGDLPAALLSAVEAIVREGGIGAVSLREASRRAGVSHSAPAHHFGDRAGLLTAFAAEGFRLLSDHMAAATDANGAATPDLVEIGVAYVRFAAEHPAHFTVMFRPEHIHTDAPDYREAAIESFVVLMGAVATMRNDLPPKDPRIVAAATGAWSAAHGFATLWLEGNLSQLTATENPAAAAADAFTAFGATISQASASRLDPPDSVFRLPAP